jgi:hypothetical protein
MSNSLDLNLDLMLGQKVATGDIPVETFYILQEDSFKILQEDSFGILTENG